MSNQTIKSLKSSETNEHYTPHRYIEAARAVMGGIDLDPASSDQANTAVVHAAAIYTAADDGLERSWYGNVFCNPPYGRRYGKTGPSNQALWSEKMTAEYESGSTNQGILLINANTGASYFKPLWEYPICFTDHRIAFLRAATLEPQTQPTHYNAFIYFGSNPEGFTRYFRQFGRIVLPAAGYSISRQ